MGNTQCGRCLTRESEMIAEIILGKDKDNKEMKDSNGAIKKISEEIPVDDVTNKYSNDNFIEKNNNEFNLKYQDNQNKYYIDGNRQINSSNNNYNKKQKYLKNKQDKFKNKNDDNFNLINDGESPALNVLLHLHFDPQNFHLLLQHRYYYNYCHY